MSRIKRVLFAAVLATAGMFSLTAAPASACELVEIEGIICI